MFLGCEVGVWRDFYWGGEGKGKGRGRNGGIYACALGRIGRGSRGRGRGGLALIGRCGRRTFEGGGVRILLFKRLFKRRLLKDETNVLPFVRVWRIFVLLFV